MPAASAPLFFAAQLSAWEQVQRLPKQVWINVVICVIAVVVVGRLWHGLKKFNDYAPWFAAALAFSLIGFYWVYERTEPRFLTPVVDQLVHFLPTKSKHEQDLERLRKSREAGGH